MPAISTESASLVSHLHSAFLRESNTYARYAAFAVKASTEGLHGVASLFRAAARSEQIHAGNHGRILHQLGGEIDYSISPVDAKTSHENLQRALQDELEEVEIVYPACIESARALRDTAATRSFAWAWEAEKTHARLFQDALDLLEIDQRESWIAKQCDFYVCPVCGLTAESACPASICPVCKCACKRFEIVH